MKENTHSAWHPGIESEIPAEFRELETIYDRGNVFTSLAEVTELAAETGASTLLISTHNGMALTYARTLRRELERVGVEVTVAMGGTLNEDIDDRASPVDLSNELRQLGVRVCEDVTDVLDLLG